jgi:monoamine oxidase
MGEEAAGRTLVAELEQVHPGAKAHYRNANLHDWVHDDFAGGGFFCLPPGYVLDHYEALVRPENGLFFAGDYGGRWIGTIEGALESAERVTEDINLASHIH